MNESEARFEEWFFANFESDPEYQFSCSYHGRKAASEAKNMVKVGWKARDLEITKLRGLLEEARKALETISKGYCECGPTTIDGSYVYCGCDEKLAQETLKKLKLDAAMKQKEGM